MVRTRPRRKYVKRSFPVDDVRRYLEPGPVVLVSSAHRGERNIMTMGWHMAMGFSPSLVGCYIWDENHSFSLIRRSRQRVINVPTLDLIDAIIGIGNCSGADTDKFATFGLTPVAASTVGAPLIAECHASFECRLAETSLIDRYNVFVFEVVKAHVAASPRYPTTVHYRGDGVFMVAGRSVSYRRLFKPGNL
ncbi:MAG TPA: flavin reductase family protein [Candidatus Tectomicrobia bacterium]|nr:flavin reductase family protein [Candidatus Tectomicrobia bacterium]